MTAPAVEIVVPGETTLGGAMVEATAEGLPPNARVQTVERATTNADVVVTLRWATDNDRRATLHVRVRDGRESERVVMFGAGDPDRERGRTLGFAIAAMIPDDVRGPDDAPPPPPPAPAPRSEPAPPRREEAPAPRPSPPPSIDDARVWIEPSAQAATGFVGSATTVGAGLAVRMPLRPLVLRIGGGVRGGEVEEAEATSTTMRGDAGLGFYTLVLDRRMTLGARAGVAVFHHTLTRNEPGGGNVSGNHTLGGFEAMAEGSYAFSPRIAVLAALGAEVAFGTTRVLVGPERVAVIPGVRPAVELGIRLAF